jgi:hypothetical protein
MFHVALSHATAVCEKPKPRQKLLTFKDAINSTRMLLSRYRKDYFKEDGISCHI